MNDSCPVCNLWASAAAAYVASTLLLLLLLQLLSLRIPSKETKANGLPRSTNRIRLTLGLFSSQPITPLTPSSTRLLHSSSSLFRERSGAPHPSPFMHLGV